MVLVATRRDAGKAQTVGLTTSKRWDCQCLSPKFTSSKANLAKRGSTKCRTRSKRRSLASDMADAIFTHPLLAEGLNALFATFDG